MERAGRWDKAGRWKDGNKSVTLEECREQQAIVEGDPADQGKVCEPSLQGYCRNEELLRSLVISVIVTLDLLFPRDKFSFF